MWVSHPGETPLSPSPASEETAALAGTLLEASWRTLSQNYAIKLLPDPVLQKQGKKINVCYKFSVWLE